MKTPERTTPPGPLPYADIHNPQSLNKYAYVLNNPLGYIDPDGHKWLDRVQQVLDVAGFIPGPVGMIADAANAAVSLARGDVKGAALNAAAIIPFAGDALKAGKMLAKAADLAKQADGVVEGAAKLASKADDAGKAGAKTYETTAENLSKMDKEKSPTGSDGKLVELHHPGGKPNAPVQEMTRTEHRLGGNYKKNHPSTNQQPSQVDRNQFRKQREQYWKQKAEQERAKQKKDQEAK